MAATTYLLFASACVVALVHQAYSAQLCHTASWGTTNGNRVELMPVYLDPGINQWNIYLPIESYECNGAVVTVCDDDVAPEVRFQSRYVVLVNRLGNVKGTGRVTAVAYCKYINKGIEGSAPPKPNVKAI